MYILLESAVSLSDETQHFAVGKYTPIQAYNSFTNSLLLPVRTLIMKRVNTRRSLRFVGDALADLRFELRPSMD